MLVLKIDTSNINYFFDIKNFLYEKSIYNDLIFKESIFKGIAYIYMDVSDVSVANNITNLLTSEFDSSVVKGIFSKPPKNEKLHGPFKSSDELWKFLLRS